MADKHQGEVTAMLHKYNIFTRHEKSIPNVKGNRVISWYCPTRDTPDLSGGLVHHINVEVKTASGGSFKLNSITDGQYEYAKKWREIRGCEFWFAIMYILDKPVHGRLKRDLFLIPFPELAYAYNILDGIQKSLPYEQEKGCRIKLIEHGLFACSLWSDFRCEYSPNQKWQIPDGHPFSDMYLNKEPYLYTKTEKEGVKNANCEDQ